MSVFLGIVSLDDAVSHYQETHRHRKHLGRTGPRGRPVSAFAPPGSWRDARRRSWIGDLGAIPGTFWLEVVSVASRQEGVAPKAVRVAQEELETKERVQKAQLEKNGLQEVPAGRLT